jgi:hypothetical protein
MYNGKPGDHGNEGKHMNIFNFGKKANKVIRTSMLTLVTMATTAIISTFETLITEAGMITLVNKGAINVNALCLCAKCVLSPPPLLKQT